MSALPNGTATLNGAQDGIAGLSVSNGTSGQQGIGPGAIVAVGQAKSVSLPAPDLSNVRSVETHTRPMGVIQPPTDLRAIIDKSATFVAKNGLAMEAMILNTEKDNPRFAFLRTGDPYHAYYKWKVEQIQKGDSVGGPSTTQQQAGDIQGIAQQPETFQPPAKPLEPPEPDQYTVRTPEGLTAEHLDIMKLTAQCVARNGQTFLSGLVAREQGNPTFHFLKPTHSLFGYFKDLCDAYSKTLLPGKDLIAKLKKDAVERTDLLERCLKRLEWEKQREAEDKAAADKAEAERIAMQSIDWHDFAVVETIDFFEDEDGELPAPMTQKDVILLNRAGAFQDEDALPQADGDKKDDDAMEMDEEEKALVAEGNADPTPPSQQAVVRIEEDDDEPMKIVKDYQRPTARTSQNPGNMAISPITGELVLLSEMAEHMRISLIDPQWKTQREAMLSKIRETTQASDDEISRNLVDLAGHRPDVFGSTQEEVGLIVKANIDDKKISGNDRAVAWDGQTRSGPALHNQINAIAEDKAEAKKRKEPERPAMPTPILGPKPPASSNPAPPVGRPQGALPPPPVRVPASVPPPAARPPMPAPPPIVQQRQPPLAPPPIMPPPRIALPPQVPAVPMPPPPMAIPQMRPPPLAPAPGPAPPPMAPVPPPMPSGAADVPDAKRQRVEFVLQPEQDFLQSHPGSSKVRIVCPDEAGNDRLNGQVLEVEVASLGSTIGDLKGRLADELALPANKQQLSREHFKQLTNNQTLAFYNVLPDVELSLSVRKRGGR